MIKDVFLVNTIVLKTAISLRWRHNGPDSVSNHQPYDCLPNRLFRRRSKKSSKLRVTGLCAGIHRRPVNSPHKWLVTRKMFPFDDVIMFNGLHGSRNIVVSIFVLHLWPHQSPTFSPFQITFSANASVTEQNGKRFTGELFKYILLLQILHIYASNSIDFCFQGPDNNM